MPGIYRLDSSQFRAWRENVPQLIGPGGRIVRAVEGAEEAALFPIVQRAKKTRESIHCRMQYPIDGVKHSKGPRETRVVKVDVVRTGPSADQFVVNVYIDGARYVTGRDIICARLLAKHGEVTLKRPNNTFLKVIRDPNVTRPKFEESHRATPAPANCECKDWGDPHPGRHHRVCPQNAKSPLHERAQEGPVRAPVPIDEVFLSLAAPSPTSPTANQPAGVTTTRSAPVAPANDVPTPDACTNGCLEWALPRGARQEDGQHNPICQYYEAYKAKTVLEEPMYIMDLDAGKRVRKATVAEAAQAAVNLKKFGASTIEIGGGVYAVLPSETGIAAQRLAHEKVKTRMAQKPVAARRAPTAEANVTIIETVGEGADYGEPEPVPHVYASDVAESLDHIDPGIEAHDLSATEAGELVFEAPPEPEPEIQNFDHLPLAEDILSPNAQSMRTQSDFVPPPGPVRVSDMRAIVEPTSQDEVDAGILSRFAPPPGIDL